jgi:hypothetical protein
VTTHHLPEPAADAEHNPSVPLVEPEGERKRGRRSVSGTRNVDDAQKRIRELRQREKTVAAIVRAKVTIGPLKINLDTYEAMVTLCEKTKQRINALAVYLIEEALQGYIVTDTVPEGFGVEPQAHQRPMGELAGLAPQREFERPQAFTASEAKQSPFLPKSAPQTVFPEHEA